ncbi:MAG: hypothetical protein QXI33_00910 [Candidatus Pacearchaeota archaeon]
MVFRTYHKDKIPEGYKKIPFESQDKLRTVVYSYEGEYVLILDRNNNREYFEGILILSGDNNIFKLVDPTSPKTDKDSLSFRFSNILEILVKD